MLMTLAIAPWLLNLGLFFFIIVSLLLVLTVLIQKPQGGGLSGAFGSGSGSGQTAFGTKTGDALTIFTVVMFFAWLVVAVLLNFAARPQAPGEVTPANNPAAPVAPADGAAAPEPKPGDEAPAGATQPPAGNVPVVPPPAVAPVTTPGTTPATTPETPK